MIRISKLADYGIVLLTQFAREPASAVYNAKDLSAAANLPLPTVSKLLKALSHAELLVSLRGSKGGYRLARGLEQISVADVLAAIEGRVAITECSDAQEACRRETTCPVRGHWLSINEVVREVLSELKLSQMARPPPEVVPLRVAVRDSYRESHDNLGGSHGDPEGARAIARDYSGSFPPLRGREKRVRDQGAGEEARSAAGSQESLAGR